MIKIRVSIVLFLFALSAFGQSNDPEEDKFVRVVEQTLDAFYADYTNSKDYDSIIQALHYEANEVPYFSDEVYCARLAKLDNMTEFDFQCNEPSLAIVKFFAAKRRDFTRIVMGRSALYFDLFEETLAKYDMPLELKYLAVIESGLRPQVRSHAGALGLWQFMYRTGKYYGLEENTYIDERMDPVKATDAACRYLKKLHEIYNDWNLALAAYNAGPGNVNKAIRRSGGLTTYWGIRPFLPRETQGYVPNFIGAAYMFTYHQEHNIVPAPALIHHAQLDTICLKNAVRMSRISEVVGWDEEEIKVLNPIYKTTYIPKTDPPQCITGPLEVIGRLVSLEDELYPKPVLETDTVIAGSADGDKIAAEIGSAPETAKNEVITHTVKRGETLASIARDYKVQIVDIREWNALRSNTLMVGQKLKITPGNEQTTVVVPQEKPKPVVKYYNVRSGDNFSTIARRHGLTQTQLKKLNPGVNVSRLNIGQRLRVK